MKEPRRINTKKKIFACPQSKLGMVSSSAKDFKDSNVNSIKGNFNTN